MRSLHLAEQRRVELVGAGVIEGQWLVGTGRFVERDAQGLGALLPSLAIPRSRIEAAAQRRHLAGERRRAEVRPHPAHVRLGHDPDEGLLGQRPLIRACRGTAQGPRRRRAGPAPPRRTPAPGSPARRSPGSPGRAAASISARRVSMAARRSLSAFSASALRFAGSSLLAAMSCLSLACHSLTRSCRSRTSAAELRRALGRPRRHLRQRGCRLRALRPLRRLEHVPQPAPRSSARPCVARRCVILTRPAELPAQSLRLSFG